MQSKLGLKPIIRQSIEGSLFNITVIEQKEVACTLDDVRSPSFQLESFSIVSEAACKDGFIRLIKQHSGKMWLR